MKRLKEKIKFIRSQKYSTEQLGMIFFSAGTIVQALIQVIIISIISRLLSSYDFGIVAILQTITSFSLIFSQFGVSQVLIQKENVSKLEIKNATTISIVLGLLISLIFYSSSIPVSVFFKTQDLALLIKYFAPYFIIKSVFIVNEGLMLRNLKFKSITRIQIISYLFGYGLFSISFAFMGYSYWSIVIGLYAQMIISGILQSLEYKVQMTLYPNSIIFFKLLKDGGGFASTTILNYFTEEIDNFIVGRKLGVSSLGVYNRAFSIYSLTSRFFGMIYDKVYFPILAKKQNDSEFLKLHYIRSIYLSTLLLTPLSIMLFINAEIIINIFLGNKWEEVVIPFQILCFSIPYRFGTKVSKNLLKSINLNYRTLHLYLSFFIILFLFLIFTIKYGLIGVASSVLLANFFNHFQFIRFVSKKLKIEFIIYNKLLLLTVLLLLPVLIFYFGLTIFLKNTILINLGITLIYTLVIIYFRKKLMRYIL